MHRNVAIAISSVLILGLAAAYAQEQKAVEQAQPKKDEMPMGRGMMQGHGMMEMMGQMDRMMENCNKMMESYLQRQDKSR